MQLNKCNVALFLVGAILVFTAACLFATSRSTISLARMHFATPISTWLPASTNVATTAQNPPADAIPRLLHYVYETDQLPIIYRPAMQSCMSKNPNWPVHLWTRKDLRLLLQRHWPELLQVYDRVASPGERDSLVRYPILYRMGGVFLQPDVRCLKPLDDSVPRRGAFVAADRPENHMIHENSPFKLTPAVVGSTPSHPWLGFTLDLLLGGVPTQADDLNLDDSFLTESYLQWESRSSSSSGNTNIAAANATTSSGSPTLLPWRDFAPNLRDPDTMTQLCRQLIAWPSLAGVYTLRQAACSRLIIGNASSISIDDEVDGSTIGVRLRDLLERKLATTARPQGQKVASARHFNATATWRLRRYSDSVHQ